MIDQSLYKLDKMVSGVKGLVYVGSKILVYRRDNNTKIHPNEIDLPGGGTEENETPLVTFIREVKEEFGLIIKPENIVYARKYKSTLEFDSHGLFVVAKLPRSLSDKVVFGNEGTEWMLMDIEEYLGAKDAWPVFQERTNDYLNYPMAEKLAKKYFALSNKSDFENIEKLFSDSIEYVSQNTGTYRGVEDILNMQKKFHKNFKTLSWVINSILELEPGVVVVDYAFNAEKNDGTKICSEGLEKIEVKNGLIRRVEISNKPIS